MEDVLAVYARPHNPARPVVCMDEKPFQLLGHIRDPLLPGQVRMPVRTANTSGTVPARSSCGPSPGKDGAACTPSPGAPRSTGPHRAKNYLTVDYPDAETVVLVMDNLNTHGIASLYEAFTPDEAFALA